MDTKKTSDQKPAIVQPQSAKEEAAWGKARTYLKDQKDSADLGLRLLAKAKARTLEIEVFEEKMVVRHPTQDRLKELTGGEADALDLKDKLAIQKGDLESLSPKARAVLEKKAAGILEKFAPLAAYLCDVRGDDGKPLNPSLTDPNFYRENEAGAELALTICIETLRAYQVKQAAITSFRAKPPG